MKKMVTLFCTLAVALSLSAPLLAARGRKDKDKKESAASTETGKAHEKHAKKKGATKGKKEGQEGSNPGH